MDKIHKFELAGLGHGCFRFLRFEVHKFQAGPDAPIIPGSSCDYCSTPIMDCYYLIGSGVNDRPFKVGSECVKKTGDRGLIDVVKRESAKIKKHRDQETLKTRMPEATALLNDPDVFDALKIKPHPKGWVGKSLWDWCSFALQFGGDSGRTHACRIIEAAKKEMICRS